jgi:hypothetical protein
MKMIIVLILILMACILAVSTLSSSDVNIKIDAFSDDAEEWESGVIARYSDDIDIGEDSSSTGNQYIALRFINISIPQDSTIVNASIKVTVKRDSSLGPIEFNITAEDIGDSPIISNPKYNISNRTRTSAQVTNIIDSGDWGTINQSYYTSNISTVIQEVIDRTDWAIGNSLSILFSRANTTDTNRSLYSLDQVGTNAAVLLVSLASEIKVNTPIVNYQSHNKTVSFNWTILNSEDTSVNYSLYADTNNPPSTVINASNNSVEGNYTFTYEFTEETGGSINGTYYFRINATDNQSKNYDSLVYIFKITNAVDMATNVSIVPSTLDSGMEAESHGNITCGDVFCELYETEIRWYINDTELVLARNQTILGAGNVTTDSNITTSRRVREDYGETAWSKWVNSSTTNVGDNDAPTLSSPSLTGLNLTLVCSDSLSTISKMNFTLDGDTISSPGDFTLDSSSDVNFNVSLASVATLGTGTHNVTQVGCLDGNGNYVENVTTRDLNFSISQPSIKSVVLGKNAITLGEITNLTIICESDNKLQVNTINFTIELSGTKVVRNNPTFFTFNKTSQINITYSLYEVNEAASGGTDNVTQVGCFDSENNYVENVTNLPIILSSAETGGGTGGGGGGGGGGTLAPEKQVAQRKIQVAEERCGNFVCEDNESPLSCPLDCRFFSLDEAFCTPIFRCGNWERAWFINSIILLILGTFGYTKWRSRKLDRL